jgi:serine/threonine-protein kinase RsbW
VEESTFKVPSALNQLHRIRKYAERRANELGFSEQEIHDIGLCVHEALTNAVVHGNRLDERKVVHVRFSTTDDFFGVSIQDEGEGYDVAKALQQLHHPESTEKTSGRGLLLILKLMDNVIFRQNGREIYLGKARNR